MSEVVFVATIGPRLRSRVVFAELAATLVVAIRGWSPRMIRYGIRAPEPKFFAGQSAKTTDFEAEIRLVKPLVSNAQVLI